MLGEAGVAAPIFDRAAQAIGAVGVAGPRERVLKRGREASVAATVIEAARGTSRDLGAPLAELIWRPGSQGSRPHRPI